MNNTFRKPEHLCAQKAIDELFDKAAGTVRVYPFLAVYKKIERKPSEPAVKVLLSVSKRRVRLAVNRNKIKRLLREAYRTNKQPLFSIFEQNEALNLAFVWIGKEMPEKGLLPQRMQKAINTLIEQLTTNEKDN